MHVNTERLQTMEALLSPARYAKGFITVEKSGVFYTTRPEWERLGVQATATSKDGVANNIASMTKGVANPKLNLIVWC